jgi:hypothetical protein
MANSPIANSQNEGILNMLDIILNSTDWHPAGEAVSIRTDDSQTLLLSI